MKFRMGELFSGPGGLALGAVQAGFEHDGEIYEVVHEWASDYDLDTCATYRHNLAKRSQSVICEDVRKLEIGKLKTIDAFAYGFPCNDFSIVGEKKGFDGTFGPLYTYGLEVLNKFKCPDPLQSVHLL